MPGIQNIGSANDNQALGYGTYADGFDNCVSITTEKNENRLDNKIARTKTNFTFKPVSGILYLDYDPSPYGFDITPKELLDALIQIVPEIKNCAYVVKGSSSAGVVKCGESPKMNTGFSLCIPVLDASDLERAGDVLFKKLFLRHGYIALSKSGSMLVRTIIDGAVFSPERLHFKSRPIVQDGLEYVEPYFDYKEGEFLDTRSIANLTREELTAFEKCVQQKKDAMQNPSMEKKAEWVSERVSELVEMGIEESHARQSMERIANSDCQNLYGDFLLTFSNTALGTVSVKEVLGNPEKYDQQSLADPVEGVGYGKTTARFFWNDGKNPLINSFAHSGRLYNLIKVLEGDLLLHADGVSLQTLIPNKTGHYEATLSNVITALNDFSLMGYCLGFDEFTQQLMYRKVDETWAIFQDSTYTKINLELSNLGFNDVPTQKLREAVHYVAESHKFDSLKDMVMQLPPHDGVARVRRFFADYCHATDDAYSAAVGEYLFTSLVGRALAPGCKSDMAVIFVGGQGCGKSTCIESLAIEPSHFCELNLGDKDDTLTRKLRGASVVELPELRGYSQKDIRDMKAFLSKKSDSLIKKYAEFVSTYDRRCIFVGSTNEDQFLKDPTGERRYLPIVVKNIDTQTIKEVRDQLWAEALVIYNDKGGVQWKDAERLARAEVDKFQHEDVWEPKLIEWLNEPVNQLTNYTTAEILTKCLEIELSKQDNRTNIRIRTILMKLGYESKQVGSGHNRISRWFKKQ